MLNKEAIPTEATPGYYIHGAITRPILSAFGIFKFESYISVLSLQFRRHLPVLQTVTSKELSPVLWVYYEWKHFQNVASESPTLTTST